MNISKISTLLNTKIYYSRKLSILILNGSLGFILFSLPSFYFWKQLDKSLCFIFMNRFFFKSFLSHLFYNYNRLFVSYFLKIRVKGLGFRIRALCNSLFYFFFNFTNFFYLFSPSNLIIKMYKKRCYSLVLIGI